jgi:hypothetical protein
MMQLQDQTSGDSYPFPSDEVLGTTMSNSTTHDQGPAAFPDPKRSAQRVVLLIGPEVNSHDIRFIGIAPGFNRRLWSSGVISATARPWACLYVVSAESMDEQLESCEVASISTSSPPHAMPYSLPVSSRGIFPVARTRSAVASETIEIVVSKLRQWRSKIQINTGRLPSEDE